MNILLDYLFKVTQINPLPAASTAFLKQVCLVVKPKVGVTPGTATMCTSMAQVEALTANTEAQQLFNAGMSRVYVLPVANLNLASILGAQGQNFFTVLVSSDFTDSEIGGAFGTNSLNGIKYTAKEKVADPGITIVYADTGTGATAVVSVVEKTITVAIEAGETTNETIHTALLASTAAMALVSVELLDDEITPPADPGQTLADGLDPMTIGTYEGVVGISSNDKVFLKAQAIIKNRCAFYRAGTTGAKNLLFAFGKLLANPLNWYNQQYIEMPFADGVTLLGDANNLFDDRISFVIEDAQYAKRLGFFVCGGQAIVAPYILKNLVIEMQGTALNYLATNNPQYTPTQASLIEDELQKVIDEYKLRQWLESGNVDIKLEQSNFVASGYITVSEPSALWRFFVELRQS